MRDKGEEGGGRDTGDRSKTIVFRNMEPMTRRGRRSRGKNLDPETLMCAWSDDDSSGGGGGGNGVNIDSSW